MPLDTSLPLLYFAIIFIVMIPFAFSISALMMAVAVFARSFKEAQNYITPFFMLITVPTVIGGFPGVQLTALTQFIPIANVVLLFRELMTGKAGIEAVFAVFLSTTIFALLSLLFAAWLFQREEVILSGEHGIPLTLRRSQFISRTEATPGMAFGIYGLVLVLIFYIGSMVQQRTLLSGLVLTEYVLILLPVLFLLWYVRIDLRSALSLRPISWTHFTGLLLAGPGAMILVIELGVWHNKVLPLPDEFQEAFLRLFEGGSTPGGILTLLLVIALSPAICEEVLFRGAILSALRPKLPVWACILVIGLMFGVFHLSIHRLIPTGLLGILLTYLVLRSGSLFSGILIHLIVNGIAVLIATEQYPALFKGLLDLEQIQENGLPVGLLSGGAVLFLSGIVLVEWDYRNKRRALLQE
jgi:sodium transport system permease protein